jgi:predicted O-methyltransferase YrrM
MPRMIRTLSRLARNPAGAAGELRDHLELRRDRRRPQPPGVVARPFDVVIGDLGAALGADGAALLEEPALHAIEDELRERLAARSDDAAFPVDFNASRALARACWVACRGTDARVVVETGVAAGLTTSVILAALEAQGGGVLHSVDIPPPGADPEEVGWLVPERLRARWTLHRGRSRRVLPQLLRDLPALDLFIHDGLHTEATMGWELCTAGGTVRPGGVVIVDDAERNPAFAEWAIRTGSAWWSLSETEFPRHYFGAAVTAS